MASNIVIADAQGTPVNHTFIPAGIDPAKPGRFVWQDTSFTNALGYWKIRAFLQQPAPATSGVSSANRVYRVIIELLEPILANITNSTVTGVEPAPTLAYVVRSSTEYALPEAGNAQNRKDISKMMPLVLQNTQIRQIVEDLIFPGT